MIGRIRSFVGERLRARYAETAVVRPYVLSQGFTPGQGRVAVVTGASGTIGRAIACRLAASGWQLCLVGRSEERLAPVAAEVAALGQDPSVVTADLSSPTEVRRLFAEAAAAERPIDLLVNCAGGSSRTRSAPLAEQDVEVLESVIDSNLTASLLCARSAIPLMSSGRASSIIFIGSALSERGKANYSEYAAAKGGVVALTRSLAVELGPRGIRVNCVSPGIVQRGVIDRHTLARVRPTNVLGEICTPEDVAEAVGFLASAEGGFITGQNLLVDGGRTLGLRGD